MSIKSTVSGVKSTPSTTRIKLDKRMWRKVLVFGASGAWGWLDPEGGGWVDRLKRFYWTGERGVPMIYNLSISGSTTSSTLKRVENEIRPRKPDVVVFALGTNDAHYKESRENFFVEFEEFKQNLKTLVTIAKKFNVNVVFVGPTRVDEEKTKPWVHAEDEYWENKDIERYSDAIKRFCKENNTPFIELIDALDKNDLHDGLHPNIEGHKKIFEKVKDELEKLGYIQ